MCVCFGSISSLIQISLNIIDVFCLQNVHYIQRNLYIYIYVYIYICIYIYICVRDCPVGWGCTILTAPLQRSKTLPMSVLDMTLNNRMVRFQ